MSIRCLNSPHVLNSLENKMVETVPLDARHVLVVNAGDGRLGRAIQGKVGPGVVVSVVTIQPGLMPLVDDFPSRSGSPWDLAWYSAQVATHGAFDCILFYQLHEFWRGELFQLQRVIHLARPGAVVWASFLNSQAQRLIARFLPPVRLGFSTLADPVRAVTNLDLASYLDLVGRSGSEVTELWGMLDQNAQEYCQKPAGQSVQWESRGVKVTIGTFADAFLWGASVVGVGLQTRSATKAAPAPKVSFAPYSSNLLQALMLPYPDCQSSEGVLGVAQVEVDAWRRSPSEELGTLARFQLDRIGGMDQPRRVLLIGSGWGRELLVLKRHVPAWDWVGFDHSHDLTSLGQDLVAAAGLSVTTVAMGSALPFAEASFDLAISLGYFSTLYEPAARQLAKEVRRVTKGGIYHLEDGRGPDLGLQLKTYSLKAVYTELGCQSTVQPVLIDGTTTGAYLLEVAAPS